MAEADWELMPAPGLDTTDVPRGKTTAYTNPAHSGGAPGNPSCFGFRAASSVTGFAGYYCTVSDFSPTAGASYGGTIRGAMKKFSSAPTYAPMIGLIMATNPVAGNGYMLGLSQGADYQVVLRKGFPGSGLRPELSDVISESDATYNDVGDGASNWFHLRLDVLVNPCGDVFLNAYANDLSANDVDSPTWAAITGMSQVIDDPVGITTGSPGFTGPFFFFFGMYTEGSGSYALFDHIEITRQTNP